MRNTAHSQIDLSALHHNLRTVRRLCPQSRVMAVVKADAYGHGLADVANALRDADGFAVARLCEALLLRRSLRTQRVLLLSTLLDTQELALCSRYQIDVTAHDAASVESILSQREPLRVWLKLDSGMHRLGLHPDEFMRADAALRERSDILDLTHMTHFSCAHEPESAAMRRQLTCFWECHATNPLAPVSIANSAALLGRPETRTDWVRPGIMLYGDNPLPGSNVRLRASMRLSARVIAIREIAAGESVGYNMRWTSGRPSRIATVGIGYGDGYPRRARNGTPVFINGQIAPIVGQISMDSLTVDVTTCSGVAPGDEVVLWGPELPAATIAECAQTISYELFTGVQRRVSRHRERHLSAAEGASGVRMAPQLPRTTDEPVNILN